MENASQLVHILFLFDSIQLYDPKTCPLYSNDNFNHLHCKRKLYCYIANSLTCVLFLNVLNARCDGLQLQTKLHWKITLQNRLEFCSNVMGRHQQIVYQIRRLQVLMSTQIFLSFFNLAYLKRFSYQHQQIAFTKQNYKTVFENFKVMV